VNDPGHNKAFFTALKEIFLHHIRNIRRRNAMQIQDIRYGYLLHRQWSEIDIRIDFHYFLMQMKHYGKRADLALDVWVKLARSFSRFNARTIEHIRHYGLTQAQFGVLECLGHLGPMKCGDLCKKQLVTGGNMTVVLDNLEKLGLVDRSPTPEDRRA